jgi:aminoglycoside phosphotransferase family enzyme/predicted kinase
VVFREADLKTESSDKLIEALMRPELYDHPVEGFRLIQTHISYVLLTGPFAYKIKKPVDMGFLDFSTLEKRRHFCEEELRLNRRLAPELYVGAVRITGSREAPVLNGPGPAVEYAVKMREFPQEAQLDRVLSEGRLRPEHIDGLAAQLAAFHRGIPAADPGKPFGSPEAVAKPVHDNFGPIRSQFSDSLEAQKLDWLEAWTGKTHRALTGDFLARKKDGFIRECHGDMHLANMVLIDDEVLIFDCLEFNENLRWIDVMSEIAFLTMDLDDRERPDFSRRVLNAYLEITGDYEGLRVLRFYQVYRALVRAKVACIRLGQAGLSENDRRQARKQYRTYETLAETYTTAPAPWLAITHGLSGSGKTTLSQMLLEASGAIRIRTDVERKRLFGLAPDARTASGIDQGLYTPVATQRTYGLMADQARSVLSAGFPVIADGAFLKRDQRGTLRSVAEACGTPFIILDLEADESSLRTRLAERTRAGRDASEADLAVLKNQIATREILDQGERKFALRVDTENPFSVQPVLTELARKIGAFPAHP